MFKKQDTSNNTPKSDKSIVPSESSTNLFPELSEENCHRLEILSQQINKTANELKRHNLKTVAKLGAMFIEARQIFESYVRGDSNKRWYQWVSTKFGNELSHDTITNFVNIHNLVKEQGEKRLLTLNTLPLSSLYILARPAIPAEVKEQVLSIVEEKEERPSHEEVKELIKAYRKIKLGETGINSNAIPILSQLAIAEDPKELKRLSDLSLKKQLEVAEELALGTKTVKEAIKNIKKPDNYKDITIEADVLSLNGTVETIARPGLEGCKLVDSEYINLAIIEAPLRSDFVTGDNEFFQLCQELYRVLAPGGFSIITLGHQGILFAGEQALQSGLKPLHVLALRRKPGRSRSIVGTNIISAFIPCIFLYKPPFQRPKSMVVDLHSFSESLPQESDSPLFDLSQSIEPSIEECFRRFMTPLLELNSNVLHVIYSNEHFSIRESLKNISFDAGTNVFVEVG